MTCPHILDWPVGSGEPMLIDGFEWCMAWISLGWTCQRKICCQKNCPYDLGDWGAWRSIEGGITRPFVDVDPASLPWVRYGVLSDMPAPPGLFAAVGWLP